MATAISAIESGRARHGRDGIYFSPQGLLTSGGKLAFLFPGVEALFDPKVDDIARHFNVDPPDVEAADLEHQGIRVFTLNDFLDRVMKKVGVRPDLLAGHSIGEWSGMLAAGMFERASLDRFLAELRPGMLRVAEVVYVAAGAGADRVADLIADLRDVFVSHDNCAHQSIVCGPEAPIEALVRRFREARILFEILPFRSGFHSPALTRHLDHYVAGLGRLGIRAPTLPLWSATTCAPYPSDPRAIGALFLEHLTNPVRFRELILGMYESGARVFVQVGTGSLAAFVDDVLQGKPHLAVSLIARQRPGMEQLRRACAALFVEGASVDLSSLGIGSAKEEGHTRPTVSLALGAPLIRLDLPALSVAAPAPDVAAVDGGPVYAEFNAGMRELATAQEDVLGAFAEFRPPSRSLPASAIGAARTDRVELSLAAFPELIDHSLIPQPPDWPSPVDRAPAAPMTMSIALLMEAAKRLDPRRTPIAVTDVLASAWLYAVPPVELTVTSTWLGPDLVKVKIESYLEGTVTLADRYPEPPQRSGEALVDARDHPVPTDRIYADGWLFHGPRYQGVLELRDFASNGMRGTLRALPAKGALLDAAGQVYGLWVMAAVETDRLAMPVRIGRIEFFGPDPAPGTVVDCAVWIRHLGPQQVRADLELVQGERVYARVTRWEDWRFETGGGVYDLLRQPSRHLLATIAPDGYAVALDPGWRSATVDLLARRFLSSRELEAFGGIRRVQRQRDWLCGRIAAKDAVRAFLRRGNGDVLFPIEVEITSDPTGRPRVTIPAREDVRISIAHKDGIGCAIVAEGADPGIDIEKIEPRSVEFAALAFAEGELALLPTTDRDEWLTRGWCAKEAAGKARGTGLAGNPKGLAITAIEHERLRVDGRWIATRKLDNHVIGWTEQ